MLKSRWAWILASTCLAVSLLSLFLAMRCRDDFFCGVRAVPMLVPAGFLFLWLFGELVPGPAILQLPMILATLATNVVIFFLLGRLLEWLFRRRARP